MNFRFVSLLLAVFALFSVGCAGTIPNTTVEDTPENREVVAFMEEYRHAVENRDVRALLDLASEEYLDHNGTPSTQDDFDYDQLRDRLAAWSERVLDVRYDIRYHRITWEEQRVYVEFQYSASFRVARGEGDQWARRIAAHRVELARDDEGEHRFRILTGL